MKYCCKLHGRVWVIYFGPLRSARVLRDFKNRYRFRDMFSATLRFFNPTLSLCRFVDRLSSINFLNSSMYTAGIFVELVLIQD